MRTQQVSIQGSSIQSAVRGPAFGFAVKPFMDFGIVNSLGNSNVGSPGFRVPGAMPVIATVHDLTGKEHTVVIKDGRQHSFPQGIDHIDFKCRAAESYIPGLAAAVAPSDYIVHILERPGESAEADDAAFQRRVQGLFPVSGAGAQTPTAAPTFNYAATKVEQLFGQPSGYVANTRPMGPIYIFENYEAIQISLRIAAPTAGEDIYIYSSGDRSTNGNAEGWTLDEIIPAASWNLDFDGLNYFYTISRECEFANQWLYFRTPGAACDIYQGFATVRQ